MKPVLHPHFFDILFSSKLKTQKVFKDVLGLYNIHHIAINNITNCQQLVSLSSTPALEFNLFQSQLWHFDQTFDSDWFSQEKAEKWQKLYDSKHYDELYYLKQAKTNLPTAYSVSIKKDDDFYIYSLASHQEEKDEEFLENLAVYTKIGQYCASLLSGLLEDLRHCP